jgi:hypothetical protein
MIADPTAKDLRAFAMDNHPELVGTLETPEGVSKVLELYHEFLRGELVVGKDYVIWVGPPPGFTWRVAARLERIEGSRLFFSENGKEWIIGTDDVDSAA